MKKEVKKYLERYWNYYIHENYVYHAFPRLLHDEIQEKGINPKKNHLAKYKKELEQLWKILEAKSLTPQFFEFGRLLTLARKSLGEHSLDFASSIEEARSFNESWALVEGINKFATNLLVQPIFLSMLSPEEVKLATKIQRWSEKWKSMEFFLVKLRLSTPAFQESLFQFVGSKDQESSLAVGSWKHFKKQVVKKIVILWQYEALPSSGRASSTQTASRQEGCLLRRTSACNENSERREDGSASLHGAEVLKKTGKKSKDITIADVEIALEKYHPFLVAKKPFSVRVYKKVKKEEVEMMV